MSYTRALGMLYLQREMALTSWRRHCEVYATPVRRRYRPRPGLSGNARQRRKERRRRWRAAVAAHQARAAAAPSAAAAARNCARRAGATPGT